MDLTVIDLGKNANVDLGSDGDSRRGEQERSSVRRPASVQRRKYGRKEEDRPKNAASNKKTEKAHAHSSSSE